MTEPDPEPKVEAAVMANGSSATKEDSGIESIPTNDHVTEKKDVEEVKCREENNVAEKMKNGEGGNAVEETGDEKEENDAEDKKDGKENETREEPQEGAEKNDTQEMNSMEETKEKEEKHSTNEMNGVEETKEGEDKNSGEDISDEKDTKTVEEGVAVEEKKAVEKTKDQEEKHSVKEITDLGEKEEGTLVRKDADRAMDTEKGVEDKEEGKREKGTDDVEMVEAEAVKEEDIMDTEERVEDVGVKLGEEDNAKEKGDSGNVEKEANADKKEVSKKKRSRSGRKSGEKGETKEKKEGEKKVSEEKEKKEGIKKLKEPLSSPTPSSIERPVRERKTVERLVEVIEKEPNKGVVIEKGRGTPLKDIPNVAYKLARKKPSDLRLLHQILFGRKGKAADFKSHILQFSGFAWHESDDKQRAKVKERLDRCVKDSLLDLCDLLDISVSKTNARKEDLISKLLDFLAAPHVTTDVLLAEQRSPRSRKRKMVARGSASKGTEDAVVKQSRKKRMKSDHTQSSKEKSDTEDEDEHKEEEDNENDNGVPSEDEELRHSVSEKENESKELNEKDDDKDEDKNEDKDEDKDEDDEDLRKGKQGMKKSSKKKASSKKEKTKAQSSSTKTPLIATTKSPVKTPSSTRLKSEEKSDGGDKVFVRKKKNIDSPKKKSTSKPDVKEKPSGKKSISSKSKSEGAGQSNPSKEELRRTICKILKKVDFNTATFTDILKQLGTHYKADLTPRKAAIKLMIQEELTKLADEVMASEDEDDGQDSEKEERPAPTAKKVEA